MKKAVLCGYYGLGNAGDEALLASLLQMLPSHITPIVLSGNPKQTSDRYQVTSINRRSPLKVIPAIQESDIFIWGGGSLIQDSSSLYSPLYYTGLMTIAQKLGKITIAWAQGIGPLTSTLTKTVARSSFAQCTKISVRDQQSANLLQNWQIPYTLAPDPVWALSSIPYDNIYDFATPIIAVNLRQHKTLTPDRLQTLTLALIDFQKATQSTILLLPFQATQDLAIASTIHKQIKTSSHILMLEDPQQLKGLFRKVEMVIGMRLHSLIMGAAEGTRCFALSYDPKVTQLMKAISISGWDLNHLPSDPNQISHHWLETYKSGPTMSSDQIQSLINRALINRDLLTQTLS